MLETFLEKHLYDFIALIPYGSFGLVDQFGYRSKAAMNLGSAKPQLKIFESLASIPRYRSELYKAITLFSLDSYENECVIPAINPDKTIIQELWFMFWRYAFLMRLKTGNCDQLSDALFWYLICEQDILSVLESAIKRIEIVKICGEVEFETNHTYLLVNRISNKDINEDSKAGRWNEGCLIIDPYFQLVLNPNKQAEWAESVRLGYRPGAAGLITTIDSKKIPKDWREQLKPLTWKTKNPSNYDIHVIKSKCPSLWCTV